jgi:hypothetical protein
VRSAATCVEGKPLLEILSAASSQPIWILALGVGDDEIVRTQDLCGAIEMRRCLSLVEAGHITADQAVDAIRHQMAIRQPIGQLAVENEMMTMNQVFDVLSCQLDCDQPFGHLAIEMNYLTHEDLGVLILQQLDSTPSLVDILIESGAVSADVVMDAEGRYEALPGQMYQREAVPVID